MKNIYQPLKTIVLALIIGLGVSYAMAWVGPTATPPGDNTPAPINTGLDTQTKSGNLVIDGDLTSGGDLTAGGDSIIGGYSTIEGLFQTLNDTYLATNEGMVLVGDLDILPNKSLVDGVIGEPGDLSVGGQIWATSLYLMKNIDASRISARSQLSASKIVAGGNIQSNTGNISAPMGTICDQNGCIGGGGDAGYESISRQCSGSQCWATCPSGKIVTGGGCTQYPVFVDKLIRSSESGSNGSQDGKGSWACTYDGMGNNRKVKATVYCANI